MMDQIIQKIQAGEPLTPAELYELANIGRDLTNEPKKVVINVRMNDFEKVLLKSAAEDCGMILSEYIRQRLFKGL